MIRFLEGSLTIHIKVYNPDFGYLIRDLGWTYTDFHCISCPKTTSIQDLFFSIEKILNFSKAAWISTPEIIECNGSLGIISLCYGGYISLVLVDIDGNPTKQLYPLKTESFYITNLQSSPMNPKDICLRFFDHQPTVEIEFDHQNIEQDHQQLMQLVLNENWEWIDFNVAASIDRVTDLQKIIEAVDKFTSYAKKHNIKWSGRSVAFSDYDHDPGIFTLCNDHISLVFVDYQGQPRQEIFPLDSTTKKMD